MPDSRYLVWTIPAALADSRPEIGPLPRVSYYVVEILRIEEMAKKKTKEESKVHSTYLQPRYARLNVIEADRKRSM